VPACSLCGEDNPARARYCSSCGAKLTEPTPPERFRKTVTIVFSDVIGFTRLGEQVDPETLAHVMMDYFSSMKPVLERHGGSVAKFIGDAVMGVFGLPELHEDDALRAARAAVEMRRTLETLNPELERRWGVALATRTGINTGEVAGAGAVRDQNFVFGDTANTAARLQSKADPGEILLGAATYRLIGDAVVAEPLEPIRVKNKASPVMAWRLLEVLPEAEAVPRHLDAPMVGRSADLSRLEGVMDRVVREQACTLLTVIGPAGVGKSRLVREFLQSVGDRSLILRGRCLPYGEGITYWPLAEIVRQAAGISSDSREPARVKLQTLLGDSDEAAMVGERVARAIGFADAGAESGEIFWAVRKLFETLATSRPLVVVFDDIQWAETTLLDLIEHVTAHSRGAPILLLCMARSELMDTRPGWGHGDHTGVSISLQPLSEDESGLLIASLLGGVDLAPTARVRITEATEGNPLFVEQLVSMLVDDGYLVRDSGGWATARDLSTLSVPPTIHALLSARLDRLDPDERQVIGLAAVGGRVFYAGALEAMSPENLRSRLAPSLLTLVRKDLVGPDRSSFLGEDAFRFRHLLIRDTAYESLPKETRAELHERFAEWLERTAGTAAREYDEILGYHLERAHRYLAELGVVDAHGREVAARAAEHLIQAGKRAWSRSDASATVHLLERALALISSDDPRRPRLLVDLGDALFLQGRFDDADVALSGAIEAASRAGDVGAGMVGDLARLRFHLAVNPGMDLSEVEQKAQRAASVLGDLGDHSGAALAWWLIEVVNFSWYRIEAARHAVEQAIAHARSAGRVGHVYEGALVSALLYGPTPVSEAVSRAEQILLEVRGSRTQEALILLNLGILKAMQGHFEIARDSIARSTAINEDLGRLVDATMGAAWGFGSIEMLRGDWTSAEREFRLAYAWFEAKNEKYYFSTLAAYLARCLYEQGHYEEAEAFTRMSEEAAARGDLVSEVVWRGTRAKVLARAGLVAEAEALVVAAVDLAGGTDALDMQGDAFMDLAEVLRLTGRSSEALDAAEKALRCYERKENTVAAGRAAALSRRLLTAARTGPSINS
jgi:class 3 adenylate cyclase/tetratricopeptide (TPR) repeat protein